MNPNCFVSIVGPGGSGKTLLVSQILLKQKTIFKPSFENIFYLYKHFQLHYESVILGCAREKISIKFHQGFQWAAVDKSEAAKWKTLVIIDDLYQDACEDATFLKLVVTGRHRTIHLLTSRKSLPTSKKVKND